MARGGLYKSDVQKARASLLAQGKHPSVDAVRVALGNTGSKTTIHRYLKEIEAEEGQVGDKVALSDALQDLVGRLAAQLKAEADALIEQAQARCDSQLREKQVLLDRQTTQTAELSAQLEQARADLTAERQALAQAQRQLQEGDVALAQQRERLAGLEQRLADREAHISSLEAKHSQAREALEHFRTSVREQRESEARRHEHEVQTLQVELRRATDAITAKNAELLQVNGEAARLTEQVSHLGKDLREAQQAAAQHQRAAEELRPLPQQLHDVQERWAALMRESEQLASRQGRIVEERDREQDLRRSAEIEVVRLQARVDTLQGLLDRLSVAPAGAGTEKTAPATGVEPGFVLAAPKGSQAP